MKRGRVGPAFYLSEKTFKRRIPWPAEQQNPPLPRLPSPPPRKAARSNMNVNEIRDKYCVDKRQTGQNFITPWGSGTSYGSGVGAFNKRKSDLPDTKRYKREQMRAGKDPLIKNKESRDQRALALKIDNAVKQMKSIRDSIKKMNSEYKEKYGSSHVYLGRNGYPED